METRYLKTLIAVVDQGTFSRAAETLCITQSAVSQRIKFLEDYFGKQLLDRSGQTLQVTPAGRTVMAKAREILEKENELVSCLSEPSEFKRLSLCCTPTFGMAFLPRVLNDFFRSHSDMHDLKFIFNQPDQALRGLQNEEYDLVIIEHCIDQDFSGFRRYSLPDDEMLFVVSPNSGVQSEGGVVGIDVLKPLRLFARRDGCSSKEILRQNLANAGYSFDDFNGVVVSDDLRFTIQSVLDGQGVAYLSRGLVADHLASERLVGLRSQGFDHRRGRSVVMTANRNEDGLLQDLLECIFQVVSPFWRPQVINSDESERHLSN